MIHREATIKYKGYDPDDLLPHSGKRICCICDGCGKVQWKPKNFYTPRCNKCAAKKRYNNKEYRKNQKEGTRKYMESKEGKKRSKEGGKKREGDRKKTIIKCDNCNKSIKVLLSEIDKYNYHFCNRKCKNEYFIGEKATMWKGGISKQSYCHLFNEPLKEAHRRYFNYLCFMENEPEENGRALTVHHVGYDKRCGCDATQFCIFVPVKMKWNIKFNGSKEYNRWYWYSFLMNKIFIEHPNYFAYHIPVWGMNELEYNYSYVFEKFRRK